MAKHKIEKAAARQAALVRCVHVYSDHDNDTLVPCQAGEARVISEEERQSLRTFIGWSQTPLLLVEILGAEEIAALGAAAADQAEKNRVAAEKFRLAEEKRRAAATARRKQKRLEKLEALAKAADKP